MSGTEIKKIHIKLLNNQPEVKVIDFVHFSLKVSLRYFSSPGL